MITAIQYDLVFLKNLINCYFFDKTTNERTSHFFTGGSMRTAAASNIERNGSLLVSEMKSGHGVSRSLGQQCVPYMSGWCFRT